MSLARLAILAGALAAWQFAAEIGPLAARVKWTDPYFISNPHRVAVRLWDITFGGGYPNVWDYLWTTMRGAAMGGVVGTLCGYAAGLTLSHMQRANQILSPFIEALNATPRLALVPLVLIFFGASTTSSVVVSGLVVALLTFFSAYAGGRSVPPTMLRNARLLGASPWNIILRLRRRYASAWTVSVLPNTLSTAITSAFGAEILGGGFGLGRLVRNAVERADATLTISVALIVAVLGAIVATLGAAIGRWVLHWFPSGRAT